MATFIFGIILLIVAVIGFIVAGAARDARVGGITTGLIAGLVGVILIIVSCFTVIATRQFGVGVAFGKPTGHYSNGLAGHAPWVKIHEVDGTIQTDTYASDRFQGEPQPNADGSCINVRIALNGTACVNISFRWQNREVGVDYLYRNFKGHDAVKNKLVLRNLQTAVNQVFAGYNPLNIDQKTGNSKNPSQAELAAQIKTIMQESNDFLKGPHGEAVVDVQDVLIPLVHFDPQTQDALNRVQAQVGKTREAVQSQQTALAQAQANKDIADSISKDPSVLSYQCLQITEKLGGRLPTGWNCFGGSSVPITASR